MFSLRFSSQICAIYILSFLLSLAVLALSLLDLGFGSLFLGIVGPCVTIAHHACTALILRQSGAMSVSLVASTPSIITVTLLSAVWFSGSIVVIIWGVFYMDGRAQMVTQAVGTSGTVVAQGVVGVVESLVLLTLSTILISTRKQERRNGLEEDNAELGEVSLPHLKAAPGPSRQDLSTLRYPSDIVGPPSSQATSSDLMFMYPDFKCPSKR